MKILNFNSEIENNDDENEEGSSGAFVNDGFFCVKRTEKLFACLTIIGQIEGHYNLPANVKTTKYEHIIPRIISVEEDENLSGLLLILNTVGGDIEAGMAIAELISGMKKPTASLVLGGGHSIGIPLAVSTDRSFIAESATMTVHPVRMSGVVMGVPQQFAYFQNMQERIIDFVCKNSGITRERFRDLMLSSGQLVSDFGTVLAGRDAVREKLIDCTGSVNDAFDYLFQMSENG